MKQIAMRSWLFLCVKISHLSEDRYQFVWAFDTHAFHASKEEDDCKMLPYFSSDTAKQQEAFKSGAKAVLLSRQSCI
jgi:hypothetical protein